MTEFGRVAATGPRGAPPVGSIDALFSADAPISDMLIDSLTAGSLESITSLQDDPDDDFEEDTLNMNASRAAMAKAMGISEQGDFFQNPPPTKDLSVANDLSEWSDTSDESDNSDSEDDESPFKIKPKYIIVGVAILFVILLIAIIANSCTSKSLADNKNVKSDANTSVASQEVSDTQRFANDRLTPTDGVIYEDSMTISKYIEISKDCCLFVFEGYAENARAFVRAYVSLEEYNKYKIGARVPILYEHITLEGKDYYMKVRLNPDA